MAGGDCYQAAFEALLYDPKIVEGEARNGEPAWLVHGYPRVALGPLEGRKYGHAWVQIGEEVYDASTGRWCPRVLYYAVGRIDPEENHLYSREEAREWALMTEHYGDWMDRPEGVIYWEDLTEEEREAN